MKSKLVAMAACLLLGGLASLATAQISIQRRCVLAGGVFACGTTPTPCHCISGSSIVNPQVTASWCRDRGPTC